MQYVVCSNCALSFYELITNCHVLLGRVEKKSLSALWYVWLLEKDFGLLMANVHLPVFLLVDVWKRLLCLQ